MKDSAPSVAEGTLWHHITPLLTYILVLRITDKYRTNTTKRVSKWGWKGRFHRRATKERKLTFQNPALQKNNAKPNTPCQNLNRTALKLSDQSSPKQLLERSIVSNTCTLHPALICTRSPSSNTFSSQRRCSQIFHSPKFFTRINWTNNLQKTRPIAAHPHNSAYIYKQKYLTNYSIKQLLTFQAVSPFSYISQAPLEVGTSEKG